MKRGLNTSSTARSKHANKMMELTLCDVNTVDWFKRNRTDNAILVVGTREPNSAINLPRNHAGSLLGLHDNLVLINNSIVCFLAT